MDSDTPGAVVVEIVRVRPTLDLPLPRYMTAGSVGLDLPAAIDHALTLVPLGRAHVPTGIAIAVPPGYEAQVRPRSGLAARHGVTILNAPGTIDADYRGEIGVVLINLGAEPFVVSRGDRVAQLVIAPVVRAVWREVPALASTGRGDGGFGHTDRVG